eukprot:scaffold6592_cov30-Tisochrysis_lutea.AAC.2
MSAATCNASEREEWRFAWAISARSSLKVASCTRRVAPRPASQSAAHGRVSPEYTNLHPAAWSRTTPHASKQCVTRTERRARSPSPDSRRSHCRSTQRGELKLEQLTKR